jgi:hypothetical protein
MARKGDPSVPFFYVFAKSINKCKMRRILKRKRGTLKSINFLRASSYAFAEMAV